MPEMLVRLERQAQIAAPVKPPYRVPLLSEINAAPRNGLRVASTFSGGGGSTTGYKIAGFAVVWANEFIDAAAETYAANHPTAILDRRDIRTVRASEVLDATRLAVGELDVLDGSPPCASFSTAGRREETWGKAKPYSDGEQVVDDLFFEFVRLLRELRPRTFLAENVSGLVKGTSKGYFLRILAELKGAGYRVGVRAVNASRLGVPQSRERVIFVGVREDLGLDPVFPEPLPYRYSIRDALGGAPLGGEIEADAWMTKYATGREWRKLKPGESSEKYFSLVRPDAHLPCPTITASGGLPHFASVAHPTECRKFSIAELKRICSFPDDYVLTGTYTQQCERLGRSVPPIMMGYLAGSIRDVLRRADGYPR